MKILITGASGMIGQALIHQQLTADTLCLVGRSDKKLLRLFPHEHFTCLDWESLKEKGSDFLQSFDAIIHLAGENIGAKRWSEEQKQKIMLSRTQSTQWLAKACASLGKNAPRIISASAIGIYDLISKRSTHPLRESDVLDGPHHSFVAEVASNWEQAWLPAVEQGVSVTCLRFGVVLDKDDGALAKLLPSFQLGLGAKIGSGQQFFPWVSLIDAVRTIRFVLEHPDIHEPINVVAPEATTQRNFAKVLASMLNKPCWMALPAPAIKLLFGQMGDELLLKGQNISCEKLQTLGFHFKHPTLPQALTDILAK